MKRKHYLIALVAIIALCSFTYSNMERHSHSVYHGEQMRILHYHGHTYICYQYAGSQKGGASIVHDPDCKCGKGGAI